MGENIMTVIGDGIEVLITGSIFSDDFEHHKEIAEQITAFLWDLV